MNSGFGTLMSEAWVTSLTTKPLGLEMTTSSGVSQ